MTYKILTLLGLLAVSNLACSSMPFLGPEVTTVKTIAEAPSEVRVFLTVSDRGRPVPHLATNHFEVYENGVLLDNDGIDLRMLPLDEMAEGYTVLLLDLSGSPSDGELSRISRGAAQFAEKVTTTQAVTVVAFDGSDRAREVARFTRVEEAVKRELPDLKSFLSPDTSRDLNSAFLAAIKGVSDELKKSTKDGKFGTVVTLVRGPDLAGRKLDSELRDVVAESDLEFFSIAPDGAQVPTISAIGKTESFEYDTLDTLPMRFQDLGMRVRNGWFSHYLLAYCSPARAGERSLKVKVRFDGEKGGVKTGSTKSTFDAKNFTGGCAAKEPEPVAALPLEEDAEPPVEPEADASETTPAKKPAPQRRAPTQSPPPPPPQADADADVVAPPSSGKYE